MQGTLGLVQQWLQSPGTITDLGGGSLDNTSSTTLNLAGAGLVLLIALLVCAVDALFVFWPYALADGWVIGKAMGMGTRIAVRNLTRIVVFELLFTAGSLALIFGSGAVLVWGLASSSVVLVLVGLVLFLAGLLASGIAWVVGAIAAAHMFRTAVGGAVHQG